MGCGPSSVDGTSPSDQPGDRSESAAAHKAIQHENLGYPPPKPPVTRKAEIFDISKYKAIDEHAITVPNDLLYKTYVDVAEYLTKPTTTDLQKVRALFRWMTSIDLSGLESRTERLPEPGTPLDYLLKIGWQMGNHAHFFAQLCRAAGLPCLVISGLNKSAAYQLGCPLDKSGMAAQWNAVLVDQEWRLMDVFWASTVLVGKKSKEWALLDVDGEAQDDEEDEDGEGETVHMVNEFFFLPDPDMLICTHLPDDPRWQLLPEQITEKNFEQYLYMRERFFELNMEMLNESIKTCVAKTKKGELLLKFGIPPDSSKDINYRYLLFKSRTAGEQLPNVAMERFVFYQKGADNVTYKATFPLAGKYKMDVFGQDSKQHETFDLVCSLMIDCNDPQKAVNPLPDNPDIGWGPGVEADEKGLQAKSHKDAVITSKDGHVSIRFNTKNPMAMLQTLKHNQLDEWLLNRFAVIRTEGEEVVIDLRLPKEGDYALELFADEESHKGDLSNVCNYLVKVEGDGNIKPQPFPKLHEGILGKSNLAKELGITAHSHKEGLIVTEDGQIKVEFKHKGDNVELICELHNNTMNSADLALAVTSDKTGDGTDFNLSLPKAGDYAMNVYARKKGDPSQVHHVHTYLIQSTQSGGVTLGQSKGSAPIIPITTSKSEIEIPVDGDDSRFVAEFRKKNAQGDTKGKRILTTTRGQKNFFKIDLPENGEYAVDIFEKAENGALIHKMTYQVYKDPTYKEPVRTETPDDELDPAELEKRKKQRAHAVMTKAYREQLRAAMGVQDVNTLRNVIKQWEDSGLPDDKGDLAKAKKTLDYITISNELTAAMGVRDLERLEKAVAAAKKAGLEKKLSLQLQMAERIIEQLKRIEKLRHEILKLDQRTIAEIKSYGTPPDAVHQVMASVFLLLGEPEKSLKEWPKVQVLIGKTGKESLKRRIGQFNVEKLPIEKAMRAKEMLRKYELTAIRDVSSGAATFYVWTAGMFEESESRFTQAGGDTSQIQTKK